MTAEQVQELQTLVKRALAHAEDAERSAQHAESGDVNYARRAKIEAGNAASDLGKVKRLLQQLGAG